MKITNIAKGPRVLNTVAGPVGFEVGQTREDVELSDAELKSLSADWWKVEGKGASKAPKKAEPSGDDGNQQADNTGETAVYKAIHRGAGSFSIVDGENVEVVEKITKAEAEKFNALSDDEKVEYVLKAKAE